MRQRNKWHNSLFTDYQVAGYRQLLHLAKHWSETQSHESAEQIASELGRHFAPEFAQELIESRETLSDVQADRLTRNAVSFGVVFTAHCAWLGQRGEPLQYVIKAVGLELGRTREDYRHLLQLHLLQQLIEGLVQV